LDRWNSVKYLDGSVRACFHTAKAPDASIFPVNNLRTRKLPLRVVAPPTVKRTTLEEHSGPNARAVVSGEFYYVKNSPYGLSDLTMKIRVID
jgi:hypothetical protein